MIVKKLALFSLLCSNSCGLNFNRPFRKIAYRESQKPKKPTSKIFCIDIDGTICTKTNSDYHSCEPIKENIEIFNDLYDKGNEIHYWTARGAISGQNWDDLTIEQLNKWRVAYTSISMGKPHYDVWIDDKAHNANLFCREN